MTILYGILIFVGLWLLWRSLVSKKAANASHDDPPLTYEIPVTVKVSHETTGGSVTYEQEDDKDNWEGSFWEVQEPFPIKASLCINYEDGAGKRTERIVDVRQFGTDGYGNLLIGHCHLRNATRTFRTDRIKKCIDEETGEIVEDVYAFLRAKYESSPEHARDKLYDEEYDTLRVLLYVGKADGQLRTAEKAIIRDTCRTLATDSRLTDAHIDEIFSSMDVPTLQAFKLAVGRLSKKPPEARAALIKAAENMIATQNTVHPTEQDALDYIRKRFVSDSDVTP